MKKFTWFFILALLISFAAAPVDAVQRRYEAQVFKVDQSKGDVSGQLTVPNRLTTGITYRVYAIGTRTDETLLARSGATGQAVTAKTNPVTTTVYGTDGGRISFVCDPTDATDDLYVDVLVVDVTNGFSRMVRNFSPSQRTIAIDETYGVSHWGSIWIAPADATQTSTGLTLTVGTLLEDFQLEVTKNIAGSTINVGINGITAVNGAFLLTRSTATNGWVTDTAVPTAGNLTYVPATTYGTYMATAVTGANAYPTVLVTGSNMLTIGGIVRHPYMMTAANTLRYTATNGTAANADALIHFKFTKFK